MNVFPEKFRFYFEKEGVKTQLKHAPEEWDTNVLKWSRDKDTEGILTEYVDKFTFVLEDADYLRDCFKKSKVFAKVKLSVYELNSNTFEYFLYYIILKSGLQQMFDGFSRIFSGEKGVSP